MTQAVLSEYSEEALQAVQPSDSLRVCFVCTGNTCRSPMAEAVANALAEKSGKKTVAFSAGLYAMEGESISPLAISALENAEVQVVAGHDYHNHTAHTLRQEEAETFDLLIGMGSSHVMELMLRFPSLASRIQCMPTPISDPYGGDLAVYEACLAQITKGVKELLFAEDVS